MTASENTDCCVFPVYRVLGIVSAAAVMLKPAQEVNKTLDRKRNILAAAGMLDDEQERRGAVCPGTTRVVDLRTGKFADEVDPDKYDQRKAAKDPAVRSLTAEQDLAKISRREELRAGLSGGGRAGRHRQNHSADPRLRPVVHTVRFYRPGSRRQYRRGPGLL